MALYTEKSYDELSNLFAREERIRQNQLRQQQEQALQEYNNRKNSLDQKYENKGLGGFLGQIVGGIGKTIGDVGKGVGGLFGTAGASIADTVNSIKDGKVTNDSTNAFKRYWYGGENDKDAAAKAAGTSLNAATNLATLAVPAAGAGTTIGKVASGALANTAAGALGGVADEFQDQGQNASFEGAANRAISGAAAGLATGGINKRIGNASTTIGSKLLNNKLATSTLGRGAISGAVGGSVGAGTSAALAGQDIESAALQGALTGATTGAAQAGLMRIADITRQDIKNAKANKAAKNDVSNVLADNTTDTIDGMPDYTKPRDWSGKELKLEKKGVVGGLGKKLENISKGIKDQDVYNSLYSKTADKVANNNSIERLRELGFEPKDYGDAAKVSTAVNKFFSDVVGNSGASITDTDLSTRLRNPEVVFQNENLQKGYIRDIDNLMSKLETGSMPGNYSAKELLDASRKFSNKAATAYRKGIDVNGNDIGNGQSDLGDAYMSASKNLRNLADAAMDGVGDNYTRGQLKQMLENMGAPKQTVEYFSNFNDLADGIRKTAVLEDGRQMNTEMNKTKIRRNATAGNSKGLLNNIADKTGATQIVNTVAEPIGRVTGGITEKVGQGLQAIDNGAQLSTQTTAPSRVPVQPMNETMRNAMNNYIGRNIGTAAASNNMQALRAEQDYKNLEDMFGDILTAQNAETGNNLGLDGSYGMTSSANAAANSPLASQMADLQNAMQLAYSSGDFKAYNQLLEMYKDVYSLYKDQNAVDEGKKLSTAEKNQLAKLESAGSAIDELEALYNKAGGGQGMIGGNIANFLGGIGLNSDVDAYNQLSQGLINQIGAAIGKTDALNTDGEVQRALSLVPKMTDTKQTAMIKLASLRNLLKTNTSTYSDMYNA